jgi:PII-like signaling protein
MRISTEAVLLRIHTSEQDKYGGKPFHEAVVKARETVRDHFAREDQCPARPT